MPWRKKQNQFAFKVLTKFAHNFKWKVCLLCCLLALLRDLDFSLSLSSKLHCNGACSAALWAPILIPILNYYTPVISSATPDLPGITTGSLIIVIAVGWGLKIPAPGYYILSKYLLVVIMTSWLELGYVINWEPPIPGYLECHNCSLIGKGGGGWEGLDGWMDENSNSRVLILSFHSKPIQTLNCSNSSLEF